MAEALLRQAASIADLKALAKARIPGFAFDYLSGGCNDENAVLQNRQALDRVYLQPRYLQSSAGVDMSANIFDRQYAAPFGIAPLGLSGLIWPRASEYHAAAAREANIPYVLSTLSSISIEAAAELAQENLWFQLYPPTDPAILNDLLDRAAIAGCENLVVTVDVPAAGRRPRDIRNGLSIPPTISTRSLYQSAMRPRWSWATAKEGLPQFACLQPYMRNVDNIRDVANYVRTTLKDVVDEERLRQLRDRWKGRLIVKGILTVEDAECAIAAGADGIIVSNHGGRQLDAAVPAILAVESIVAAVGDHTVVMADGGVESGPDIARFLAQGAEMVFAGRAFMYGVGALGEAGAEHSIDILRAELNQVLEQLRCESPLELPEYLAWPQNY